MRYLLLASDYDGTLAQHGIVSRQTIAALERLRHSGRKFVLVTGRELSDLQSVFPPFDLCDLIVAENGALVYDPAAHKTRRLAKSPPESFIADLRKRGVNDLSVGEVIVATWRAHERAVVDAIRDAGLELQVICNKDAIMILPAGIDKSTGLCAALDELKVSARNVVGVGDAENDHAFLHLCECSVAVQNAIPALKDAADFVTSGADGEGVQELIDELIANDLSKGISRARLLR